MREEDEAPSPSGWAGCHQTDLELTSRRKAERLLNRGRQATAVPGPCSSGSLMAHARGGSHESAVVSVRSRLLAVWCGPSAPALSSSSLPASSPRHDTRSGPLGSDTQVKLLLDLVCILERVAQLFSFFCLFLFQDANRSLLVVPPHTPLAGQLQKQTMMWISEKKKTKRQTMTSACTKLKEYRNFFFFLRLFLVTVIVRNKRVILSMVVCS